jgi:hypothetical protein
MCYCMLPFYNLITFMSVLFVCICLCDNYRQMHLLWGSRIYIPCKETNNRMHFDIPHLKRSVGMQHSLLFSMYAYWLIEVLYFEITLYSVSRYLNWFTNDLLTPYYSPWNVMRCGINFLLQNFGHIIGSCHRMWSWLFLRNNPICIHLFIDECH